ncbi:Zn-dependent protease [Lysobacter enzymogenes]|uniref:site-2 protease family protein n=1 Tax=Lysobacter enzymogenes TaxID=69 RepID=UPI003393812D
MSTDATAAESAAPPGGDAPALRDLSPRALRRWTYLSRFWLGATCGALVVALSELMAGPRPVPVALLLGASLLAVISVVPVHECGHWWVARLRRMAVAIVAIGPLELQPRRRGLRMRLRGRKSARRGLGGWVVALPDPRRDVRRDAMWMAAGGGLANLCFAAACLVAALLLPLSPLRSLLWPLAMMHIATGVLNLLPYLVGGHTPSDGLNLWRLSRNRYEDLPGWSLKLVLGHFAAGLPADRLDPALLRRMAAEPEPMPLMRDWLEFDVAQQAGAADDAARARALARMRERAAAYTPQQRESVADVLAISEVQEVFYRALGGGDREAVRALSALDLRQPTLWRVPQVAPRVRALAAALRGDAAAARVELERARRHAENDPVPAVAEHEAVLRERIVALLHSTPANAGAAQ